MRTALRGTAGWSWTLAVGIASLALLLPAVLLASGGGGGGGSGGGTKRDPTPYYEKGNEALRGGRFAEAEAQFAKVVQIIPDNAQANYMLGLAQEGKQDFRKAVLSYKKALRIDRKHYEARAHLGLVALKLGERKDAEKQLGELEEAGSKCASKCAADEQSRVLKATQQLKGALGGARTSRLELQAPAAAGDRDYQRAVALLNANRYEEAIALLRQAEAAEGPSADTLNYLGFAHRKLKRYDEARRYYAQALSLEPLHRGANEYLGELYIETGRIDLALQQLQRLQQLCAFGCAEEEELRHWLAQAR